MKLWVFFLWLCCLSTAKTQDLFSLENSLIYTNYLKASGQYDLLLPELEKLANVNKTNDSIVTEFLQTCRLMKKQEKASLYLERSFEPIPEQYQTIYLLLLFEQNKILESRAFIATSSFSQETKDRLNQLADFYAGNLKQVNNLSSPFTEMTQQWNLRKRKSPGVALSLSIALPGTGKMYAGRFKDGLAVFSGFGLAALQAYMGFNARGIRSVYGWLNAGLALGIYSGNLYGSYKAAKEYNFRHEEEIKIRARHLVIAELEK